MKVDPILTAREVAEDLRVSKAQVHRLFRGEVEGVRHLPYLAIGRRQVVPRSALEKWKKENVSGMIPGGSEENAVARN